LQLIRENTNTQWMMVIERGVAPSQPNPDPTSTNLENIIWEPRPVLEQRIIVTRNYTSHQFGVRIKRSLVMLKDTLTCDTQFYGIWHGANEHVPETANFALRARLIDFDTENRIERDARGWLSYALIGTEDTDSEGNTKTNPPQARIY